MQGRSQRGITSSGDSGSIRASVIDYLFGARISELVENTSESLEVLILGESWEQEKLESKGCWIVFSTLIDSQAELYTIDISLCPESLLHITWRRPLYHLPGVGCLFNSRC